MVKTILRIGNSQGLIFDSALLDATHLKLGDQVNLEVHDGGTITVTPVRRTPPPAEVSRAIKRIMRDYARTMKNLS